MFLISNVKPVNTEKEKTAAFLADLGWRRAYLHPFTVEHFQKAAEQAIRDCSERGITSFILNPHEPLDRLFLEPILRLREEAAIQWYAFFVYEAEETEFLSSEEPKVVELRKTVSGTGYLYPRLRSGGMSYLPSKPKIAMNHYCACVMNYCHVLIGGFYAISNVHRLTEQAGISLINLYQDCYYDIHPESPKWARAYDPYRSPKDYTRCIRSLIQDARFRELKTRLSNERLEYAMLRCPWKRGFDWIYEALNQAMQYAVEFCTHYAFQCSLRKQEHGTVQPDFDLQRVWTMNQDNPLYRMFREQLQMALQTYDVKQVYAISDAESTLVELACFHAFFHTIELIYPNDRGRNFEENRIADNEYSLWDYAAYLNEDHTIILPRQYLHALKWTPGCSLVCRQNGKGVILFKNVERARWTSRTVYLDERGGIRLPPALCIQLTLDYCCPVWIGRKREFIAIEPYGENKKSGFNEPAEVKDND